MAYLLTWRSQSGGSYYVILVASPTDLGFGRRSKCLRTELSEIPRIRQDQERIDVIREPFANLILDKENRDRIVFYLINNKQKYGSWI